MLTMLLKKKRFDRCSIVALHKERAWTIYVLMLIDHPIDFHFRYLKTTKGSHTFAGHILDQPTQFSDKGHTRV